MVISLPKINFETLYTPMLIFHTADWHLGNIFHRHERLDEHRHFFDWMLQQLKEHQPDAMIVAGDVFDNANPSAAAEKLYYEFLQQAVDAVSGLQIVIIAGNHDSAHRLEAPSPFLKANNIYVRGSIKQTAQGKPDFEHYLLPLSSKTDSEAKLVCMALPYLRACDYPSGLTTTEGIKYYFEKLKKALAQSDFKKLPTVVAAHFYAHGANISDEHSERLVVGGQDLVETKVFDKYFNYVALGHIHLHQQVGDNPKQPIYYSGSVLPMSFSEKHYHHGVRMVRMDDEGHVNTEFLNYTPLRKLISIPSKGACTPEEILEAINQLPDKENAADYASWPYLELRVIEQQPEPTFLNDVTMALKNKAIHFCRIVREYPQASGGVETTAVSGIESTAIHLQPTDLAKRIYFQRFHNEMPDEMLSRLQSVL